MPVTAIRRYFVFLLPFGFEQSFYKNDCKQKYTNKNYPIFHGIDYIFPSK
jgi:hypothetical protein